MSQTTDRSQRIQQVIDACIERRAAGEAVLDEQLAAEYPELMPELADRLANLGKIQRAQRAFQQGNDAGLQIRCPQCHNQIEIIDDRSLSDVLCPSCGSQFSLTDDSDRTFQADRQEMVNHFRLLDRVGVGAFGSVWSARDTQLDRMVALKIPRKGQLSADDTEQFIREARAAAQLKHPHIVSVLEVGRYKDRVYIATDFIQGLDLADWLTDQQATPREAAELCVTMADALQHAHDHGVIHRDLKPSNIMLDLQGEPHLMDFGLAKRDAAEITMTVDGKLLGTPAYMSPEQARGAAHDADARSDIYSLGVVLFEALTGERPFRGNTRMLLHKVLMDDPPSPRRLNSHVPRDLETICLKCLEKSPDKRYRTAAELRDDLRRFIHGEPVRARPISRTARGWRWCKRNPAWATVLGCVVALAIGGPLVALRMARLAGDLRDSSTRETVARQDAEIARDEMRRLLYVSDMGAAQRELQKTKISRVVELLERHHPARGAADLRGPEWYLLWGACERAVRARRFDTSDIVGDLQYSDDGRYLTTVGLAGQVVVRDVATLEVIRERQTSMREAVCMENTVHLSPDGHWVVTGLKSGLRLTNLETGEVSEQRGAMPFTAVRFSPDGQLIAAGSIDGSVHLFDRSNLQPTMPPMKTHSDIVFSLGFTPDGKRLISGSRDLTAQLWDVSTGQALGEPFDADPYLTTNCSIYALEFSPDERILAMGTSGDFLVLLWDVQQRRVLHRLTGNEGTVYAVDFSSDGSRIAAAAAGGGVRVSDVSTGTLIDRIPSENAGGHNHVEFSPDDTTLVSSAGALCQVRLWDLNDAQHPSVIQMGDSVRSGDLSPDGRTLATGRDGVFKIWDLQRRQPIYEFEHTNGMRIKFGRNGRWLATCGFGDSSVRLWDAASGQLERELPHEDLVFSVSFSPTEDLLACMALNRGIRIWDLSSDSPARKIDAPDIVMASDFSPDGKTLACSGAHYADVRNAQWIKLFDVASGKLMRTIPAQGGQGIWQLEYSPDGSKIAFGGHAGIVQVWDLAADRELMSLSGHGGRMTSIWFTPDGRTLLTAGGGSIRFWDLSTGELRFEMQAHQDSVTYIGITPDHQTLITGSADDTIKLWPFATEEAINQLRRQAE